MKTRRSNQVKNIGAVGLERIVTREKKRSLVLTVRETREYLKLEILKNIQQK